MLSKNEFEIMINSIFNCYSIARRETNSLSPSFNETVSPKLVIRVDVNNVRKSRRLLI